MQRQAPKLPTVLLETEDHNPGPESRRRSQTVSLASRGSLTFGRERSCDFVLRPANPNNIRSDRSTSRLVGQFVARKRIDTEHIDVELWNFSTTNWLLITGERGLTTNLAPRSRATLSQEWTVVWLEGELANYGFYISNDSDADVYEQRIADLSTKLSIDETEQRRTRLAYSADSLKNAFSPHHRLIIESVFADYLSPRPGVFARPRAVADVYENLKNNPMMRSAYGTDNEGRPKFKPDHIVSALQGAIETARDQKVPGLGHGDSVNGRAQVAQSEWNRHRLALFLLGAGVITAY